MKTKKTSPNWGGARPGAGRKPSGRWTVPHRARPVHRAIHPVHVTLKTRDGLPSLRDEALVVAITAAITAAAESRSFRVIHFSVQAHQVQLIVEARDAQTLTGGVQGLTIRIARAINRTAHASGRVWKERYEARDLTAPREVRDALDAMAKNAKGVTRVSAPKTPLARGGARKG